jgi:hypothetical protein
MDLEKEIRNLLNRASAENQSDTPDFVLAQFLAGSLSVFNSAIVEREAFYGRECGGQIVPVER